MDAFFFIVTADGQVITAASILDNAITTALGSDEQHAREDVNVARVLELLQRVENAVVILALGFERGKQINGLTLLLPFLAVEIK